MTRTGFFGRTDSRTTPNPFPLQWRPSLQPLLILISSNLTWPHCVFSTLYIHLHKEFILIFQEVPLHEEGTSFDCLEPLRTTGLVSSKGSERDSCLLCKECLRCNIHHQPKGSRGSFQINGSNFRRVNVDFIHPGNVSDRQPIVIQCTVRSVLYTGR